MRAKSVKDDYSISCDQCGCTTTYSSYKEAVRHLNKKDWQIGTKKRAQDLCPSCKKEGRKEKKIQSLIRKKRGLINRLKEKEQEVLRLWNKRVEIQQKIQKLRS